MRILSMVISSMLPIFVMVAASGSVSVAADSETRNPRLWCWWDGEAPFCGGDEQSCKGNRFMGTAASKDEARDRLRSVNPGVPDSEAWRSFGKDCVTGVKAHCCMDVCPSGYRLLEETVVSGKPKCGKIETKTRGLEIPLPDSPAQVKKKAPIEAPTPYEELNKGPIVAPAPYEELQEGPIAAPEPSPQAIERKKGVPITSP